METLLDAFFSDRSSTGLIRLLDMEQVVEYYFDALGSGVYVSLPSLFAVRECKSDIAGEERLKLHLNSNNIHMHETFELVFERLKTQST
jgi:hypothetical protein